MKPTARLLTPRGRGAVATVRVDAPACDWTTLDGFFLAVNGKPLGQQDVGKIVFGHWGTEPSREEVVVCRIAPDTVEIHSHGGDVCVKRILNDLAFAGFNQTSRTDFDPLAEVEYKLQQATTLRTAAILLRQIRLWRSQFLRFTRMDCPAIGDFAANALTYETFGVHLTQPWQVVIVGPPNAGKSTLLNALLGFERAIVFDQPGTTRDVLSVQSVVDGWPIVFSDTAGLRESGDAIERAGINAAEQRAQGADLRLLISDLSAPPVVELREFSGPAIRVGNKSDIQTATHPLVDAEVSALNGKGMESLLGAVAEALVPELPPADVCLPVSARHADWLQQIVTLCESNELQAVRKLTTTADPCGTSS